MNKSSRNNCNTPLNRCEDTDSLSIPAVDEWRELHPRSLDDLYRTLEPVEREKKQRGLIKRFWEKVGPPDENGCRLWTAARPMGYGTIHYKYVRGKPHKLSAHRLSYILEYGEIPEGAHILHDCGDYGNKACVNPLHLRPGGDRENMLDAVRHGVHACRIRVSAAEWEEIRKLYFAGGTTYRELAVRFGFSYTTIGNVVTGRTARPKANSGTHPTAILTAEQVAGLRRRVAAGERLGNLASELGVCQETVFKAAYGTAWGHLPGALPLPGPAQGERIGNARLTTEQVRAIRRRAATGEPNTSLAREFDTDPTNIGRIVRRERWAWLPDEDREEVA